MNEIDFLKDPIVLDTTLGIKTNKLLKDQAEYNLFTLSSYNAYLENFHSDVIASLLNTKGLHKEGQKFIILFISFLNQKFGLSINTDDFIKAEIYREIGNSESHIDILIEGNVESIVIENKINNAMDMNEQVDRYYTIATNRGFRVSGIVYLTLDGVKQAPTPFNQAASHVIKSIGAFTNTDTDLVNGWLIPCLNTCTNEDSRSLIYQYIKLIKHLAHKNMDTTIKRNFYQFISENNYLENTPAIVNLIQGIPEYRADKLVSAIKNYLPFQTYYPYKPNYRLYENYFDGEYSYKLDFAFNVDGSAFIRFWIPTQQNEKGRNAIYLKLKSIAFDTEFEEFDSRYERRFPIKNSGETLIDMDNEILAFMESFLLKLRQLWIQ